MKKLLLLIVAASVLHVTETRSKKKHFYKEKDKKTDLGFTRCHNCKSWENEACGLNFTVPYWLGVRCYKAEICRKITYYENDTLSIVRDCVENEDSEELGCRVKEYMNFNATICVCEEDYCNRCDGLFVNLFVILCSLLTGLRQLHYVT